MVPANVGGIDPDTHWEDGVGDWVSRRLHDRDGRRAMGGHAAEDMRPRASRGRESRETFREPWSWQGSLEGGAYQVSGASSEPSEGYRDIEAEVVYSRGWFIAKPHVPKKQRR